MTNRRRGTILSLLHHARRQSSPGAPRRTLPRLEDVTAAGVPLTRLTGDNKEATSFRKQHPAEQRERDKAALLVRP